MKLGAEAGAELADMRGMGRADEEGARPSIENPTTIRLLQGQEVALHCSALEWCTSALIFSFSVRPAKIGAVVASSAFAICAKIPLVCRRRARRCRAVCCWAACHPRGSSKSWGDKSRYGARCSLEKRLHVPAKISCNRCRLM